MSIADRRSAKFVRDQNLIGRWLFRSADLVQSLQLMYCCHRIALGPSYENEVKDVCSVVPESSRIVI